MKTNLLTLLIFAAASVLYSCTKESDYNYPSNSANENSSSLTSNQRRIIISNCSGHTGCHSGSRIISAVSMEEVNSSLKNNIDANHSLSFCERTKLQSWFNGEAEQ